MRASVTFVIPVYNGLPYLHEAIQSVLNQTYTEWQLFLVDDGSADGSVEEAARYLCDRVSIHSNGQNLGLYPSLSAVLRTVETDWVVILMQDDRLKPNYLAEMLTVAGQHPDVPAVWANEDIIGCDGQLLRRKKDTHRLERIIPGTEAWLFALMRGCFWTISGSLTTTEFFRAHPFRSDLPHCGDYEWLLRVLRTSPLLYYERTLAELREHPGQSSAANLASGRNVRESYSILAENLRRHPSDAPRDKVFAICLRRASLAIRQMLGAIAHRRASAAIDLARHAAYFMWLPFSYQGVASDGRAQGDLGRAG